MDLTLSLTHDCNLACSYCYAGKARKSSMNHTTANQAVDFAFSFDSPRIQLGFFGGEPLLEWELLKSTTLYAEELARRQNIILKKTLTTNSSLATAKHVEWLFNHDFVPALSIDGNRAMHDITRPFRGGKSSFERCIEGLASFRAFYTDFEVIIVPDPSNVHLLSDSVRYLVDEENVPRVSINPNFYTHWNDKALELWRRESEEIGRFYLECYRKGKAIGVNFIDGKIITRLKNGFEDCDRCGFGEFEIAVAPSGRIYPCERLIGEDRETEMCIGDVFRGFDFEKRREILRNRDNVNEECHKCTLITRCMNWCCCINYTITGFIDQTDGIVCFHERMAIEIADRVAGILFAEGNTCFLKRFYYEDFDTA